MKSLKPHLHAAGVITGHDQPGNAEQVRALGALDYLLKPLNESQLLTAIGKVIQAAA